MLNKGVNKRKLIVWNVIIYFVMLTVYVLTFKMNLNNNIGLGKIVEYVYKMGHKKIAFIHGEMTQVTKDRLKSFENMCEKLRINIPPEYVLQADYHLPRESGLATRKLLDLNEKPTCIIYPDDYSFMGGMTEIEKHGLNIPDDISVVGYDGIYLSTILRPSLTTYVQNSTEIGKQAALKLIEQIENPKDFVAKSIIISGKLQKGQTVKNIKSTF